MKSFNWASTVKPCKNDNSLSKIRIEGLLTAESFQKARLCALKLYGHLPHKFAKPEIRQMLEITWLENIQNIRRCLGGKAWNIKKPVVVFIDDELIGSDDDFIRHIGKSYAFKLPLNSQYYENLIVQEYRNFMKKIRRKYVYLNFTIDAEDIGSLLIMLYTDLVPRTCQHFLKLCTGYRSKNGWAMLSYKDTKVHRVVENGWLQIGDILDNEDFDESVLNEITIDDESYCVPHDRRGVVSLANDGRHSNRDQFIVSLKANNWMDCRYVAFGQLIEGANTLSRIENVRTYYEAPVEGIFVSKCGEYTPEGETVCTAETDEIGECERPSGNDDNSDTMDENNHNFPDKIDERDAASLMMIERYEKGLYSLSTDNLPNSSQEFENQ